jgi:outer membrane receptor for ferric coprogen and ferric-rhodotorulic acid
MSERTTGATDAQIEAAARNRFNDINHYYGNEWYDKRSNLQRHVDINNMADCAEFLVPEGMVIAPAADVLTSDQRQIARNVIELMLLDVLEHVIDEESDVSERWANREVLDQLRDLLRAIADGGAK